LVAQQLVGAGEVVIDVPPKLSARVRLMDTGRIDKSDPNDARSAAVVALRNATLNVVSADNEDRVVLRMLADRYHQLTSQRTRTVCRRAPARHPWAQIVMPDFLCSSAERGSADRGYRLLVTLRMRAMLATSTTPTARTPPS
jgi:hypothetical protein